MKTAILYSGHMRSFDRCAANHRWMVRRFFPKADVFCATVFDADAHKVKLLDAIGAKTLVCDQQPVFTLPPGCPVVWAGPPSFYMHEPYAISASPSAIIGQLWQLQNVWGLIESPEQYDCFIRIRPDIYFHEFELRTPSIPEHAFIPAWGGFGGCNDRFALLGRDAAEMYFTTFSRINELIAKGCPLHPESLISASMEGCCVSSTLTTFSKMGNDGKIARWPEIGATDIARMARG